MNLTLLAGGAFAVGVILLADNVDAITDRLVSSDDPLTDVENSLDSIEDA